jgi:hypothetical protein
MSAPTQTQPVAANSPQDPRPEFGDRAIFGVKMQYEPNEVPPGYCCDAINMRFNKGVPESRRGVSLLTWCNKITGGQMGPWGTVYGWGTFRDPLTKYQFILIAADGGVYYTAAGNVAQALSLPTGVTVTDQCRFVQQFNVVYLLRGPSQPVLQMRSVFEGFVSISQTSQGNGTFPIPNSARGLAASNRLFLIQDDTVLASDLQDGTRYSIFKEMLVNQGAEDRLLNLAMFGNATMICLKEKSIYRVDNVYGDLSAAVLTRVTERYGCVAPDSVVDLGTDMVWLCREGIASLTLTQQNEVQTAQGALSGKWPMFSDDIKPLIKRINWSYAQNAWGAFNDGKLYMAVPLDNAEVLGLELAQGNQPNGSNLVQVTNLTPGANYRFVQVSPDGSLTNGTQTLTGSGDFTAQGTSVTISCFIVCSSSLKRVYKGVNNAVLVYDTQSGPNGAWAGHDEGAEILPSRLLKVFNLGQERLFAMDPTGWIRLYEEGYEDQMAIPYSDLKVNAAPANGATLQVNGGTLLTTNGGTTDTHTGGTGGWATGADRNIALIDLWMDQTANGGYAANATNPWTAPNTTPTAILGGVRFYASNGVPPAVALTGTSNCTVTTMARAPILATYVSREYSVSDLSLQQFNRLWLDLQTWAATFTVDLLAPGVNRVLNLCTNRTKDRTLYYRPFDRPPYNVTNVNDDFLVPNRQDYSAQATPAGFLTKSGMQLGLHQEAREPFHFNLRARGVQMRLVNSTGRVRIICTHFKSHKLNEKGAVLG